MPNDWPLPSILTKEQIIDLSLQAVCLKVVDVYGPQAEIVLMATDGSGDVIVRQGIEEPEVVVFSFDTLADLITHLGFST